METKELKKKFYQEIVKKGVDEPMFKFYERVWLWVRKTISQEITTAKKEMGEELRMTGTIEEGSMESRQWGRGYNSAVDDQNKKINNYLKNA